MAEENIKIIAQNRKARHDYFIVQSFEAGIVLVGTEVKSLRQSKLNLSDGYAIIKDGEVWLLSVHINVYDHGNRFNHEPTRNRKLLLNKREIRKMIKFTEEKGNTIVPLKFYFKDGKVKVELGIAKGKKLHDKRDTIAKKDAARDFERKVKL